MAKRKPKTHLITSTKQLRSLKTPIRQQIIAAMAQLKTCSVSELAPHVGLAPESLYYHIKKLARAGLIRVNRERLSGKRLEKVYELVAPRILVDSRKRSKGFLDALGDLYGSVLRAAERDLRRTLGHEKTLSGGSRKTTDVRRLTARLDGRAAAKVRQKIDELMEFIADHDDEANTEIHSITTVFNLTVPVGK